MWWISGSGLLFALMFLSRYGLLAKWRASAIGRHMMAFSALNAAIFAWLFWLQVARTVTRPEWSRLITVVLVSCFAALLGWRLVLFEVEQWRGRRGTDGRPSQSDAGT